jgi:hypothetical protein
MTSNLKLTIKEKNILRLKIIIGVISFFVIKTIISDWNHFKAGLTGSF